MVQELPPCPGPPACAPARPTAVHHGSTPTATITAATGEDMRISPIGQPKPPATTIAPAASARPRTNATWKPVPANEPDAPPGRTRIPIPQATPACTVRKPPRRTEAIDARTVDTPPSGGPTPARRATVPRAVQKPPHHSKTINVSAEGAPPGGTRAPVPRATGTRAVRKPPRRAEMINAYVVDVPLGGTWSPAERAAVVGARVVRTPTGRVRMPAGRPVRRSGRLGVAVGRERGRVRWGGGVGPPGPPGPAMVVGAGGGTRVVLRRSHV
ncbi:hypothetical protein HNR61_007684 [Actinomadura namibiensis]|uniref:Uncharacterized protein n=1 Tax=Actinomadura namibiensis TaxID=182080 RepID=A0A7W3LXF6_ACTNM|nr:hypothetical protein [Actinomadura namibiensis]